MPSNFVVVLYIISPAHGFVMLFLEIMVMTILRRMGNTFAKDSVIVLGISYALSSCVEQIVGTNEDDCHLTASIYQRQEQTKDVEFINQSNKSNKET